MEPPSREASIEAKINAELSTPEGQARANAAAQREAEVAAGHKSNPHAQQTQDGPWTQPTLSEDELDAAIVKAEQEHGIAATEEEELTANREKLEQEVFGEGEGENKDTSESQGDDAQGAEGEEEESTEGEDDDAYSEAVRALRRAGFDDDALAMLTREKILEIGSKAGDAQTGVDAKLDELSQRIERLTSSEGTERDRGGEPAGPSSNGTELAAKLKALPQILTNELGQEAGGAVAEVIDGLASQNAQLVKALKQSSNFSESLASEMLRRDLAKTFPRISSDSATWERVQSKGNAYFEAGVKGGEYAADFDGVRSAFKDAAGSLRLRRSETQKPATSKPKGPSAKAKANGQVTRPKKAAESKNHNGNRKLTYDQWDDLVIQAHMEGDTNRVAQLENMRNRGQVFHEKANTR